jgi:hypothetical protein
MDSISDALSTFFVNPKLKSLKREYEESLIDSLQISENNEYYSDSTTTIKENKKSESEELSDCFPTKSEKVTEQEPKLDHVKSQLTCSEPKKSKKASEAEPKKSKNSSEAEPKKSSEAEPKKCSEVESKKSSEVEPKKCSEVESKKCSEEELKKCSEEELKKCSEEELKKCSEEELKKCSETESKKCSETESKKCSEAEHKKDNELVNKSESKIKIEIKKKDQIDKKVTIKSPKSPKYIEKYILKSSHIKECSIYIYNDTKVACNITGNLLNMLNEIKELKDIYSKDIYIITKKKDLYKEIFLKNPYLYFSNFNVKEDLNKKDICNIKEESKRKIIILDNIEDIKKYEKLIKYNVHLICNNKSFIKRENDKMIIIYKKDKLLDQFYNIVNELIDESKYKRDCENNWVRYLIVRENKLYYN